MTTANWLPECSAAAVADALRTVAPDLPAGPVVLRIVPGRVEPQWRSGSAVVAGRYLVKFAWSEPAAHRLAHEVTVLTALTAAGRVPFLPAVAASSTDPVLLVTYRQPGRSLSEVVDRVNPDRAGRQLARFLAALHAAREPVAAAVGPFPEPPAHHARPVPWAELEPWIPAALRPSLRRRAARADALLAEPGPPVLVHGDLHGDNMVWRDGRLVLVADFETAWLAEPEYDFRALPGTGPDLRLATASMAHYERITGRRLSRERVLAWHLRAGLADLRWRSEAGIALPDGNSPDQWLARLSAIG